MPGISFSEGASIKPAIAWRYRVILPSFGDDASGATNADGSSVAMSGQKIQLLAQRVNITQRHIDPENAYIAASVRVFPTQYMIDAFAITFIEVERFDVMRYIRRWQERVIDKNGYYGLPKDYKRQVAVFPLNVKGEDAVKIPYADCWPTAPAPFDLDSTQMGYVTQAVTFVTDNADLPE